MEIKNNYVDINNKCRSGKLLQDVKGIILYGTDNRTCTEIVNDLHSELYPWCGQYIIDCDGNVVATMDEKEVAHHVHHKSYTQLKEEMIGTDSNPNNYFIGVVVGKTTRFPGGPIIISDKTYTSLYELLASVCTRFNLSTDTIYQYSRIAIVDGGDSQELYLPVSDDIIRCNTQYAINDILIKGDVQSTKLERVDKNIVDMAVAKNLVCGDDRDNFLLEKPLYRQDAILMLDKLKLLGDVVPQVKLPMSYSDKSSVVSRHAIRSVRKAYKLGIIKGYGEHHNLLPKKPFTLRETLLILNELQVLYNGQKLESKDVIDYAIHREIVYADEELDIIMMRYDFLELLYDIGLLN